jgi:hypothetical protein
MDTRIPLIGLFAIWALTACGSSDETQKTGPVAPVAREQAPEDPTAKMARAVPIGGATAPVNVKYEILNKPMTGSPVEIELAVIPTQGADSMTVTLAGSSGLTLSMDAAPSIDTVEANKIEHVKFSAQAREATVFYVTVTTTVYSAGTSSARNFAIPIIMTAPGAAAEKPTPAAAAKKT